MSVINKILLCSCATMALAACSSSGPRYVPRPNIPPSQYTQQNHWEDKMDTTYYNQYEQREPCQFYRREPRNMIVDGCRLLTAPVIEPAPQRVVHEETVTTTNRLLPIVSSYVIYFDFDKSNIRASEQATLTRVADEIRQYNPAQITVTGHTDTSGSADYNQRLSNKRANSVVFALNQRGISSQVVDEEARGESDPAVPTADGVKLQENRRVVIDFRR